MAEQLPFNKTNWQVWEKRFFVAGSIFTAMVAMIAEAGSGPFDFYVALLFMCISVVSICSWALFEVPSVGVAAIVVACSMLALGWSVDDPETALFHSILIATAVGIRLERLSYSLLVLLLLVTLPLIGTLGPLGAKWGWWNWSMGALLTWSIGRLIRSLKLTLDELVATKTQLIGSAAKEERLRISNDVHDLVGHSLTAMLLNIRAAQHTIDNNVDVAKSALADAEQVGTTGLADIRAVLFDLREKSAGDKKHLSSLPDGEAILHLLDQQKDIDISADAAIASMQGPIAVSLHRIIQECITNILKHAVAGSARISLSHNAGAVVLESSNSIRPGYQADTALSEKSMGLISMRERASSLGGTFTSETSVDQWLIRCRIPLNA